MEVGSGAWDIMEYTYYYSLAVHNILYNKYYDIDVMFLSLFSPILQNIVVIDPPLTL